MRFLDCKTRQLRTARSHPQSYDVHMESDLLMQQVLVTVLVLIMDAKEQAIKTAERFAHTNYSSRNRMENRIKIEFF